MKIDTWPKLVLVIIAAPLLVLLVSAGGLAVAWLVDLLWQSLAVWLDD